MVFTRAYVNLPPAQQAPFSCGRRHRHCQFARGDTLCLPYGQSRLQTIRFIITGCLPRIRCTILSSLFAYTPSFSFLHRTFWWTLCYGNACGGAGTALPTVRYTFTYLQYSCKPCGTFRYLRDCAATLMVECYPHRTDHAHGRAVRARYGSDGNASWPLAFVPASACGMVWKMHTLPNGSLANESRTAGH